MVSYYEQRHKSSESPSDEISFPRLNEECDPNHQGNRTELDQQKKNRRRAPPNCGASHRVADAGQADDGKSNGVERKAADLCHPDCPALGFRGD